LQTIVYDNFYNKVYVTDSMKNCPQNNIKQRMESDWNVTINIVSYRIYFRSIQYIQYKFTDIN